jgi:probable F420-dependent oxidoreductase
MVQFGARFPLSAWTDPIATRDYAQALDGAGVDYVTTAGHVLATEPGAFTDRPLGTYAGPFYEPFVLFGYLAGITRQLRFMTSVFILPLFPTAVVAAQSAQLSTLSGGRFTLGVGISWNPLEYRALGQDVRTRGARLEEQVTVLRKLWTEPFVTYQGRFHTFEKVGLNHLPPAPIPVWMGGTDERVLRRMARVADGWLPMGDPVPHLPRLHQYVREASRDPASFGVAASVTAGPEGPAAWVAAARRCVDAGVTHLTLGAPPDFSFAQALDRIVEAKQALAAEFGAEPAVR